MGQRKSLNLIAIAVWGLALGCGADGDHDAAEQARLRESLQVWSDLKGSDQRQYRYTSLTSSWTGSRGNTTIDVVGDIVVSRAWELFDPDGMQVEAWTEDTASLGSHPHGAAPLTIDQIYDRCASEVLPKDPAKNWITLTFMENGVLEYCSYFPNTCADDCSQGFNISSLELR